MANPPKTSLATKSDQAAWLAKIQPQIALALPKHLNADRMTRLALTAFSVNPALAQCTPASIAGAIITAAQLGLEPGVMGQCYLIPYGQTCTFIPGWRGIMDLVNRGGRASCHTGAIYDDQIEGKDWTFIDGSERKLVIHKQSEHQDESRITHAYAVGTIRGNETQPVIELWPVAKIKRHRDAQVPERLKGKHYSLRHWEMYCRKVVLLQVIKYMPTSIELQNVASADAFTSTGIPTTVNEDGFVINAETGEINPPPQQDTPDSLVPDDLMHTARDAAMQGKPKWQAFWQSLAEDDRAKFSVAERDQLSAVAAKPPAAATRRAAPESDDVPY